MEPPRLPSFFKTSRPKTFEFKPRYYNEDRERHHRMTQNATEGSNGQNNLKNIDLKSKWSSGKRGRMQSTSLYRLAAILAALTSVAWWLLFS